MIRLAAFCLLNFLAALVVALLFWAIVTGRIDVAPRVCPDCAPAPRPETMFR